jgi:hypothetical protein
MRVSIDQQTNKPNGYQIASLKLLVRRKTPTLSKVCGLMQVIDVNRAAGIR